jgi:hypothetical protein
MCLKGGSDLVGCLQRVVNSAIPRGVVNHTASIPATWLVPKYLAPSRAPAAITHRRDRAPGPAQWVLDYPDTAAWIDRHPAPVSGLPGRSA